MPNTSEGAAIPPEPAPTTLRSAPREFERVNASADTPASHPTDVKELFALANAKAPTPAAVAASQATNEVHAMLRENLAHANAAGLNELKPLAQKISRRRRDYWVALVGGNGLLAALVLITFPNIVSLCFGVGGMLFYSLALTWLMWVLLDDY